VTVGNFHIDIFSHPAVTIIMDDETYIDFKDYHYKVANMLDGVSRMRFIEGIFNDYTEVMTFDSSKKEQRQYRELLTELVKNFGH